MDNDENISPKCTQKKYSTNFKFSKSYIFGGSQFKSYDFFIEMGFFHLSWLIYITMRPYDIWHSQTSFCKRGRSKGVSQSRQIFPRIIRQSFRSSCNTSFRGLSFVQFCWAWVQTLFKTIECQHLFVGCWNGIARKACRGGNICIINTTVSKTIAFSHP